MRPSDAITKAEKKAVIEELARNLKIVKENLGELARDVQLCDDIRRSKFSQLYATPGGIIQKTDAMCGLPEVVTIKDMEKAAEEYDLDPAKISEIARRMAQKSKRVFKRRHRDE